MKLVRLGLVVALFATLALGAQAAWVFDSNIGPSGESAQYIDIDSQGDIWVTNYATPTAGVGAAVVVFSADGSTSTIISQGQIASAPVAYSQPGGVAADRDNGIVYTTGRYDTNQAIFAYNDATNAAIDGISLTGLAWHSPGDIDVFTSGTKTYIAMTKKTAAQWGVLDPAIGAPTAYVHEYGVAGWHLNRGIGVDKATKRVYSPSESADEVRVWNYTPAGWVAGTAIASGLGDINQRGAEVDAAGNVYVSCNNDHTVRIYDNAGTALETIADATNLVRPSGVAFGASKLYIAQFTSAAPMISVWVPGADVSDWSEF